MIALRDSRVALMPAAIFFWLLDTKISFNREGRIEISNEELGHLVGASRQRINQALHALERSGLIKVAYRVTTVLDIEGLRSFGM